MSYRIEQTTPLALLRELPSLWAQTCFTGPPRDISIPYLVTVLEEVRRVLREDGTLWLAVDPRGDTEDLHAALALTPWQRIVPSPRPLRMRSGGRLLLFAKQPDGFLYEPSRAVAASRAIQSPVCPHYPAAVAPGESCRRCPRRRRAWCVPPPQRPGLPAREAIEWCVISSTVPRACRECGTPWRRAGTEAIPAGRWRTMCRHTAATGRSLVIDPFCATGETGIAALRRGRDFLGIEPDPRQAKTARERLARAS
jgi:hypothetical protein